MAEPTTWRCVLTADGHEPFVHVWTSGSGDKESLAKSTAQVWLLGHPERRSAKNISVTVEENPDG